MTELPLIFMAGLLGSSHCLGMCGGFALTIGTSTTTWRNNVTRQFLYTAGRLFTYGTLGAIAGYAGARLETVSTSLLSIPALLAIVAGVVLVYQGLLAVGWLRGKPVVGSSGCLAGSFFRSFLTGPQPVQTFLAGLFTGLLPCGLLYGMVALAASGGAMHYGAATMIVFGLGTAPLMIAAGMGGRLLTLPSRRRVFQLAACCLILTGVISTARGATQLFRPASTPPAEACPFCLPAE